MKVETNLKAGNVLNDVANLGCQSLNSSANFVNNANQQVNNLAKSVTSVGQTTWNKLTGWL